MKKKVSFLDTKKMEELGESAAKQVADTLPIKKNFIQLRDQQVVEMNAGKTFVMDLKAAWPEPSKQMTEKWMIRHPSYTSYSTRYMSSQRRMLFLGDLNPMDRFEAFERLCYLRQLAPTTAETYWTTWLGVQKAIGIAPCDADPRTTKILKARSTAYPIHFPTPATLQEMQMLQDTFQIEFPSLTAIVMFAFVNGQRISDMVQIAVSDITIEKNTLMITVRRGKTMMTSQPYTLWMRREAPAAEAMINTWIRAKKSNRLFLLSEMNADEERAKLLSTIRDMITSTNDQLELRSIRRGGLQRMASLGFSLDRIITFSRHSDTPMLMRYLGWGSTLVIRQKEMIEMTDAMMQAQAMTTQITMNE
jgi:integrase